MDALFWEDNSNAASSPDAAAARAARHRSNRDMILRLLDSVRSGEQEDVTRLLSIGISPFAMDPYRGSAFHQAAVSGDEQIFTFLIQTAGHAPPPTPTSPSLHVMLKNIPPPLHLVVWNSHLNLLNNLLRLEHYLERLNTTDANGITPMHIAAYRGNPAIITSLLQAGAIPNVRDNRGATPLMYACSKGNSQVVEQLLLSAADTTILDDEGRSCLEYAAVYHDDCSAFNLCPRPCLGYENSHWTSHAMQMDPAVIAPPQEMARRLIREGAPVRPMAICYASMVINPLFLSVTAPMLRPDTRLDLHPSIFLTSPEKLQRSTAAPARTDDELCRDALHTASFVVTYMLDSTWADPLDCAGGDGSVARLKPRLLPALVRLHAWERRKPAILLYSHFAQSGAGNTAVHE